MYVELRRQDGTPYWRSSLLGCRATVLCHLQQNPRRYVDIYKDPAFRQANETLNGQLKQLKCNTVASFLCRCYVRFPRTCMHRFCNPYPLDRLCCLCVRLNICKFVACAYCCYYIYIRTIELACINVSIACGN